MDMQMTSLHRLGLNLVVKNPSLENCFWANLNSIPWASKVANLKYCSIDNQMINVSSMLPKFGLLESSHPKQLGIIYMILSLAFVVIVQLNKGKYDSNTHFHLP